MTNMYETIVQIALLGVVIVIEIIKMTINNFFLSNKYEILLSTYETENKTDLKG